MWIKKTLDDFSFSVLVGIPGLEPGKAGPESAVLPLHHIPKFVLQCLKPLFLVCECKGTNFFCILQENREKFSKKVVF